jgi:hypothetical protein
MVKVITFPIKEELIWSCNCGNQSFYVHSDGNIECVACNTFAEGEVQDVVPRKIVRMLSEDQRNQWEAIAEQLNLTTEDQ